VPPWGRLGQKCRSPQSACAYDIPRRLGLPRFEPARTGLSDAVAYNEIMLVQHITLRLALTPGGHGSLCWERSPSEEGSRFVTGSRSDCVRLAQLLLAGLLAEASAEQDSFPGVIP
jgi:hypothetical protein